MPPLDTRPAIAALASLDDESARRPDRAEAEAAIRTLLAYTGENPDREGLSDTPKRVVKAFDEYTAGYQVDPGELLGRTFDETAGYDGMIALTDIAFVSHCEHHLAPIVGRAHVAYLPRNRVVGISKLARLVETFARRLQIQERMTNEIARAIDEALSPRGVAVIIEGRHHCMISRGVRSPDSVMTTRTMLGAFSDDRELAASFERAARVAGR
jgi:GTP cyclohydrolase I